MDLWEEGWDVDGLPHALRSRKRKQVLVPFERKSFNLCLAVWHPCAVKCY